MKNSLLLNKTSGSFYFLAEIILDLELEYDGPIKDFCGTCTACMDACPTDAMPIPGEPCRSDAELTQPSRLSDDFCLGFKLQPPKQREEDALRRAEQERAERKRKEEVERRRQAEAHERQRWDQMAQAKMLEKKSGEIEEAERRQDAFLRSIEEKQYGNGNSACPNPGVPSTPTPDLMSDN